MTAGVHIYVINCLINGLITNLSGEKNKTSPGSGRKGISPLTEPFSSTHLINKTFSYCRKHFQCFLQYVRRKVFKDKLFLSSLKIVLEIKMLMHFQSVLF